MIENLDICLISEAAEAILSWFEYHGRKNLPWQKNINPYRVWVSETMLQQTQVKTVIPYFQKFMLCWPTLEKLANASQDHVMQLWSGLGYYRRAIHLHTSAKYVVHNYQGKIPSDYKELITLPGIGKSTAGAILSIAYGMPTPILDGNVKRVLCRLHAIEGEPNQSLVSKKLWELAAYYTPQDPKQAKIYTQAIMDLGATVCKRTNPSCTSCPLQLHCKAFQNNLTHAYPQKKSKKILPVRPFYLLLIREKQQILFIKRPPQGIWSSLWCFPQYKPHKKASPDPTKIADFCKNHFSVSINKIQFWPEFRHTFTHFHSQITIIEIDVIKNLNLETRLSSAYTIWKDLANCLEMGLPAPIKSVLKKIM